MSEHVMLHFYSLGPLIIKGTCVSVVLRLHVYSWTRRSSETIRMFASWIDFHGAKFSLIDDTFHSYGTQLSLPSFLQFCPSGTWGRRSLVQMSCGFMSARMVRQLFRFVLFFRDVALCVLIEVCRRYGGTCCLRRQDRGVCWTCKQEIDFAWSLLGLLLDLKMEAVRSTETLNLYRLHSIISQDEVFFVVST
jgi:hypothetical protein